MVEAVEQLPGPELNPQYCQKEKRKRKTRINIRHLLIILQIHK
jgi:hypothetical protein